MSCDVRHRCSSDPALLWLWHRPAAVAPIQPLVQEPPYATSTALKKKKRQKKKRKKKKNKTCLIQVAHMAEMLIVTCGSERSAPATMASRTGTKT